MAGVRFSGIEYLTMQSGALAPNPWTGAHEAEVNVMALQSKVAVFKWQKPNIPVTMNELAWLKWAVTLVVPLALGIVPLRISIPMQAYLALTLWAVLMWMFRLIPEGMVGALLPVLYLLFKVGTPQQVFQGWQSGVPWITLGGLIIGSVMVNSGLAKRIAYRALAVTGSSLSGVILGISVAAFVITPFIPSVMGKVSLMVPLVIGMCQASDIKPESKTASAMMLAVFFALWSPKMAFLTASADSVLMSGLLAQYLDLHVSWAEWAYEMFVPGLLWTAVSVALVFLLRPEKIEIDRETSIQRYRDLGPLSKRERKTMLLVAALLVALATDSIHGINPAWTMVVMASLCFVPGIDLLKQEDLRKINFPIIFFLVGSLAIGTMTKTTGTVDLISKTMIPYLHGKSQIFVVLYTWCFAVVVNFILNPLAAISTFMVPMAEVFQALGYDPYVGGYATIMGFNHALFPYEIAPLMLVTGTAYSVL